jgi:isopenicillin-N epimerase
MTVNLRQHWLLAPQLHFLNHGSFGACPKPVLAVQQRWRERLEQDPMGFMVELEGWPDEVRQALAAVLDGQPENFAFLANATHAANSVLRSWEFQPGDEILTTDHEYNANRNAIDYICQRSGAQARIAPIPFPLTGETEIVEAILTAVTARTRLVLLDHITSQTALVLPIQAISTALAQQGVPLVVDGAHAPGQVPVNLDQLVRGACIAYFANGHKWLCAPKSCAFLYVHPDWQARIRPLSISHGANSPRTDRSRFLLEFDWPGTWDATAVLAWPAAIAFLAGLLPGGLPALMAHNHRMVVAARRRLVDQLGIEPPCPDHLLGAMASLPLPDRSLEPPGLDSLQTQLLREYAIQVPIIPWPHPPKRLIRISAQIYNQPEEYGLLSSALEQLL